MFAGEVARRLGLQSANYAQLRTLLRIVGGDADERRAWGRFTFRDLVAMNAAVTLARDKANPYGGQRMMLAEVERVCRILRDELGIAEPLTTVRLRWQGRRIVAQFDGVNFEPASRQLLLTEKAVDAVVRQLPTPAERAACEREIRHALSATNQHAAASGTRRVRGVLPLGEES